VKISLRTLNECIGDFALVQLDHIPKSPFVGNNPHNLEEIHSEPRGGLQNRVYHAKFTAHEIMISTYWTPEGKLEQFLVEPE
jgi:hypothetical protein